jgi:hypothetical protein
VGVVILALAGIALLFAVVKNFYLTLPYGLIPGVDNLRRLISQLLLNSSIFARLWQVIPTWNYLYILLHPPPNKPRHDRLWWLSVTNREHQGVCKETMAIDV